MGLGKNLINISLWRLIISCILICGMSVGATNYLLFNGIEYKISTLVLAQFDESSIILFAFTYIIILLFGDWHSGQNEKPYKSQLLMMLLFFIIFIVINIIIYLVFNKYWSDEQSINVYISDTKFINDSIALTFSLIFAFLYSVSCVFLMTFFNNIFGKDFGFIALLSFNLIQWIFYELPIPIFPIAHVKITPIANGERPEFVWSLIYWTVLILILFYLNNKLTNPRMKGELHEKKFLHS